MPDTSVRSCVHYPLSSHTPFPTDHLRGQAKTTRLAVLEIAEAGATLVIRGKCRTPEVDGTLLDRPHGHLRNSRSVARRKPPKMNGSAGSKAVAPATSPTDWKTRAIM